MCVRVIRVIRGLLGLVGKGDYVVRLVFEVCVCIECVNVHKVCVCECVDVSVWCVSL